LDWLTKRGGTDNDVQEEDFRIRHAFDKATRYWTMRHRDGDYGIHTACRHAERRVCSRECAASFLSCKPSRPEQWDRAFPFRHFRNRLDSIPNFNGQFFADGFDPFGNPNRHWYTSTVGNPPQMGGTTVVNAPIQPIKVELEDANGNLVFFKGHPITVFYCYRNVCIIVSRPIELQSRKPASTLAGWARAFLVCT
jgi:hypothetical protein